MLLRTIVATTLLASVLHAQPVVVTIDHSRPHRAISPYIYGSNGNDAGAQDGITIRRQGGNRLTGYNWENNYSHAGEDWQNSNDTYLPWYYHVPENRWQEPGVVLTTFIDENKGAGIKSLVTLPVAGYVSADANGSVTPEQVAPSARFHKVEIEHSGSTGQANTDDDVVYVEDEVRFLTNRYGAGAGPQWTVAYSLDNEPALWPETHPRIHPDKTTFQDLMARSIRTATVIRAVDPTALIYGPAEFGFSGFTNLQDAPDKSLFMAHGSFIDGYLMMMKMAEGTAGKGLLDVLDVHWYPNLNGEAISFNDNLVEEDRRIQAPRSLWDESYAEDSWIGQWYGPNSGQRMRLPLLPTLQRIIDERYPGTMLSISEFNYGGPRQVSTGLAVADALGILGNHGVYSATHWEAIDGYIRAAYRLYRNADGNGLRVGDSSVVTTTSDASEASAYTSVDAEGRMHVIVIWKANRSDVVRIAIDGSFKGVPKSCHGFDGESNTVVVKPLPVQADASTFTLAVTARSAYHIVFDPTMSSVAEGDMNDGLLINQYGMTTGTSAVRNINVYDVVGNLVYALPKMEATASITWPASLGHGAYVVMAEVGGRMTTGRMLR